MALVKREVRVLADAGQLSRAAAEEFVRRAQEAVRDKGVFTVALSGGSTPKSLYSLLSSESEDFRSRIPWSNIHFFWGDERHVAADDPESNYRMANETLLSKVPVPPGNVHRIRAENPDAALAAKEYEETLRQFFKLTPGQLPRFDLVLLGMGPCGHTASLFPGTEALNERERLVVAQWVEKFNAYRITMTPPVLNNAASVIFIVGGTDKAETLHAVLEGDDEPARYPAQLIRPTHGDLLWLVDEAAAARLEQAEP